QKTSSVAVTQGWGSHDLLADLGNNATFTTNSDGQFCEPRRMALLRLKEVGLGNNAIFKFDHVPLVYDINHHQQFVW
ncbi:hypothetical protein, partial [Aeromonas enteropelogenes]|uniref:hypothetical protein n=1 Tax=Aeromonas enteropelogenes TaxID=29489 RepID=UPI003BA094BF